MANHPNSVFGASATQVAKGSSTRVPASNTGSDPVGYALLTSNFIVTTNDVAATPSIDAVSVDMGINELIWAPSGNTHASGTFKSPPMWKITVDLSSGNVVSPGHAIGAYIHSVYKGSGTADLGFGVESKLTVLDAGTNLNKFSFFKPAIGLINGTVDTIALFDCEMDLTGIGGSVTHKYGVYSPRSNGLSSVIEGGFRGYAGFLYADTVLSERDSGCSFMTYGASGVEPVVITVPSSVPAGCVFRVAQLGTGQVTVVSSGGNNIFNKAQSTPGVGTVAISEQLGEITITVYSSGSGGAVLVSGDVSIV